MPARNPNNPIFKIVVPGDNRTYGCCICLLTTSTSRFVKFNQKFTERDFVRVYGPEIGYTMKGRRGWLCNPCVLHMGRTLDKLIHGTPREQIKNLTTRLNMNQKPDRVVLTEVPEEPANQEACQPSTKRPKSAPERAVSGPSSLPGLSSAPGLSSLPELVTGPSSSAQPTSPSMPSEQTECPRSQRRKLAATQWTEEDLEIARIMAFEMPLRGGPPAMPPGSAH